MTSTYSSILGNTENWEVRWVGERGKRSTKGVCFLSVHGMDGWIDYPLAWNEREKETVETAPRFLSRLGPTLPRCEFGSVSQSVGRLVYRFTGRTDKLCGVEPSRVESSRVDSSHWSGVDKKAELPQVFFGRGGRGGAVIPRSSLVAFAGYRCRDGRGNFPS